MASILDFLANGQQRRQRLDQAVGDFMTYITPPNLRPAAEMAAQMNLIQGMSDSMQQFGVATDPTQPADVRRRAAIGSGVEGLLAVTPAALAARGYLTPAQGLMESVIGGSPTTRQIGDDIGRFAADEAGQIGLPPIGHNGGPRLRPVTDTVNLPPHSRAEWSGAAPSRTEPYPRYVPRNTTERMQRLQGQVSDPQNPIRGIFDAYIEKGKTLGGPDWYNTEELRDWFVSELGEEAGDANWREFMELIGTTSTGAKVPANIRMASFYRALAPQDRVRVAQMVKDRGMTPRKAAEELGVAPPNMPDSYGYGHIKQRNQAGNVLNREAGLWGREIPEGLSGAALSKWLQANPKVKGFGNDLLGDDVNIAADMHFMRMLAMADGGGDFLNAQAKLSKADYDAAAAAIGPRKIKKYTSTRMVNGKPVSEVNLYKAWQEGALKDTSAFQGMPTAWADTPKANEYAAYEQMAKEVAETYGMTPAQFQASLWMGAGDITGLADESQGTFMELFRRSLDQRASERGITRKDMLMEFLNNRAVLSTIPAMAGTGLLGASQQQNQQQGILPNGA